MSSTLRLPPYNLEAEQGVIGAMIRDNDIIGEIARILRMDSFYHDAHQKVWDVIMILFMDGKPVDLVIIHEELKRRKQLDDIGGAKYLADIWEITPTGANAVYYAELVRDKALLRSLIHVGTEMVRDAYDQTDSGKELVHRAEAKVMGIAEGTVAGKTATLGESVVSTFDRIDSRAARGQIGGLATHYIGLDELTGGFHDGELVVIGARPSVGKTAIAINLAVKIAEEGQAPVLFISLEMSKEELTERMLCRQARVDGSLIRTGKMNGDIAGKLVQAGAVLSSLPIHIDDSPEQRILQIAATARRHKSRNNIRAVFIDYLQLIEPEDTRSNRHEQVAIISRRLKLLARELKIPVIVMAQLNRESENRADRRPIMADLRESGAVEQDANTIFLLHRVNEEGQMQAEEEIEIIVAKQRNGPTGTVRFIHRKQFAAFEEYGPQP